ncbi:hypothetical protein TNCV_3884251 [Trichonephila clavipes]|nr:hypothetical protein TNCV_3884251 [Trichonephila clavipes]
MNENTQLDSRTETTRLCGAVDCLQPPTTTVGTRNETTRLSRRKQLNSAPGTKQLDSAGGNNSTQQDETTQLNSVGENNSTHQQERNNSTLHCRRPPTTACTAFTAESAFSTY